MPRTAQTDDAPVRPYFNVVVRPKTPHERRLDVALKAAPPSVLARYAAAHRVSAEKSVRLWQELARFLFLCAANPTRRYGLYGPVDDLWHEFILHTADYAAFCKTHIGHFVHHHPGGTAAGAKWQSRYLQFLFDYRDIYGRKPPDDLWPIPPAAGLDAAALPKKASTVTPGHVKAVFEILNGALPGTALGKVPGHKAAKRRKKAGARGDFGGGCGAGGGPGKGGDGGSGGSDGGSGCGSGCGGGGGCSG